MKLDVLNILDIECTCWEGQPPQGQEQEIIEIGVCALKVATLTVEASESILVRPSRSTVSAFCTELTTLTQEQVDQGVAFSEACAALRARYRSRDRVWASYGDFDRVQFERQCRSLGVEYPFGRRHLNVKAWLALTLGLPREVGMAEGLKRLRLPLEGKHHRGGDDARNIAQIAAALLGAARSGLRQVTDVRGSGRG